MKCIQKQGKSKIIKDKIEFKWKNVAVPTKWMKKIIKHFKSVPKARGNQGKNLSVGPMCFFDPEHVTFVPEGF